MGESLKQEFEAALRRDRATTLQPMGQRETLSQTNKPDKKKKEKGHGELWEANVNSQMCLWLWVTQMLIAVTSLCFCMRTPQGWTLAFILLLGFVPDGNILVMHVKFYP